jgi:NADPH:quinone reductase-like Zn-dependent oxidoreductase
MAPDPSSHSFRRQDHIDGADGQPSPLGPGEILVRVHARATGAMPAAGTVIAAGDRVTRFAVGDDVFGHFPAESWACVDCARMPADGPHVEHRPEGLDPLAAVVLAQAGLTAKTILRAAKLRPGQTALVVGATSRVGTMLVALLADAGAHVIAGATPDDVRSLGAAEETADQLADALASHPDVDLLVDLVSFGEPYFLTAAASHGTIVTADPGPNGLGVPCIAITAAPGDLAALAQRTLDGRQRREPAHVHRLEKVGQAPANRDPVVEPELALAG